MTDSKIYVLLSDCVHIEFENDIEAKYIESSELGHVNTSEFNIIFIKDLKGPTYATLANFLDKCVETPGLIVFFPLQRAFLSALSSSLSISKLFTVDFKSGDHVIWDRNSWLATILSNLPKGSQMKYEGTVVPTNELQSLITTRESIDEIRKSVIKLSPAKGQNPPEKTKKLYEVVAENPGSKTVSAIYRSSNGFKLILYPMIMGDWGSISKLIKKLIEEAIKYEVGIERKNKVPKWVSNLFPEKRERLREIYKEFISIIDWMKITEGLYYQNGIELENAVEKILSLMDVQVKHVGPEKGQKDLILEFKNGKRFVSEVKGFDNRMADLQDISVFGFGNLEEKDDLCLIINQYRLTDSVERANVSSYPPISRAAIDKIKDNLKTGKIKSFYVITTLELAKWYEEGVKGDVLLKRIEESQNRILGIEESVPIKLTGRIPIKKGNLMTGTGEQSNEEKRKV